LKSIPQGVAAPVHQLRKPNVIVEVSALPNNHYLQFVNPPVNKVRFFIGRYDNLRISIRNSESARQNTSF